MVPSIFNRYLPAPLRCSLTSTTMMRIQTIFCLFALVRLSWIVVGGLALSDGSPGLTEIVDIILGTIELTNCSLLEESRESQ